MTQQNSHLKIFIILLVGKAVKSAYYSGNYVTKV